MEYPGRFPEALQKRVETVRDSAELRLREAISTEEVHRLDRAWDFIIQVFREFAHQTNEAERQGIWTASEHRKNVDSFLARELIPYAYDLARLSTFSPAAFHDPLSLEEFRLKVEERIKESDVWREHLEERLAYRDVPPERRPDFTWRDVTIRFISEHTVQISVGGSWQPPQNYKEMGFADGRTQNPSLRGRHCKSSLGDVEPSSLCQLAASGRMIGQFWRSGWKSCGRFSASVSTPTTILCRLFPGPDTRSLSRLTQDLPSIRSRRIFAGPLPNSLEDAISQSFK